MCMFCGPLPWSCARRHQRRPPLIWRVLLRAKMNEAIRKLYPLLSEARRARIDSAVASRTNSVTVVLENVTDEGNENAVMRTMDALGFQFVHRVREPHLPTKRKKTLQPSRTDSGARSWLTVYNWNDTLSCAEHLKQQGYVVAVTSPEAGTDITEIDFSSQKIAVAFGQETRGVSNTLMEFSDVVFSLPMCGFVQSFNVSVAVAITLFQAYSQRVAVLVGRHFPRGQFQSSN